MFWLTSSWIPAAVSLGGRPRPVAIELKDSRNILFANFHAYRVTRSHQAFPAAIRLYHSSDIHLRNVHINGESGFSVCDDKGCGTFLRAGRYPYENSIQDITRNIETREREFAALDIAVDAAPPAGDATAVAASGAKVEKITDGFHSISGAAADAKGKLYFVDHWQQRIFGWSRTEGLTIERDSPLDPVNLAIDKSGNIIVQSWAGADGTVYAFRPGSFADELTVLKPQPAGPRPAPVSSSAVLSCGDHSSSRKAYPCPTPNRWLISCDGCFTPPSYPTCWTVLV